MRFCVLFVLLALVNRAAFAQASPPVPRTDSLATATPAQPAADTLAAIHQLFAQRRRQQTFGALSIVAAAIAGIAVVASSPSIKEQNLNAVSIGVLSVPVLAIELFAFDSFNRKFERQEVADFKAHRLSRWLKRRLKPRFFY